MPSAGSSTDITNPQPCSASPFGASARLQPTRLEAGSLAPTADASFSAEQKQYLEGFFAGARQSLTLNPHTTKDAIAAQSSAGGDTAHQPALFQNTPVEDLCREELWNYERNPLDAWDELLAHTNENKPPNPEHTYRFKFHGFFYVAPAQDSFMLRMRAPGGVLTSHQMRGLARMAAE